MGDKLRQSSAFLPRRSEAWIWISKPSESRIKKFIRGRCVPTAALSVEGPAKNELCRTIMFSSHASEQMVNKRGLPDPSPGNDCNDVDILVCPCTSVQRDFFLSTKNSASGNGQCGYGNLLRRRFCQPLASYCRRSHWEHLLQALTSDSTACFDSTCYRGYRPQQLVRSPETLCRIFLKEFLKENDDRLWNIFEPLKW